MLEFEKKWSKNKELLEVGLEPGALYKNRVLVISHGNYRIQSSILNVKRFFPSYLYV